MAPRKKGGGRRKSEATQFLESLISKRVIVPWESVPGHQDLPRDEQTPYGVVGRVREIDKTHPGCVIVKLDGDSRRFFFPGSAVAEWLEGSQDQDGDVWARVRPPGEQGDPMPGAQQAAPKYHDPGSHSQLDELADAAEMETEANSEDAGSFDGHEGVPQGAPLQASNENSSAAEAATSTVHSHGMGEDGMGDQGPDAVHAPSPHGTSNQLPASQMLLPEPTFRLGQLDDMLQAEAEAEPSQPGHEQQQLPRKRQKRSSEEPATTALQPDEPCPTSNTWPDGQPRHPCSSQRAPDLLQPPEPFHATSGTHAASLQHAGRQAMAAVTSPAPAYVFLTTPMGGLVPMGPGSSVPLGPPRHFFQGMLYTGEQEIEDDIVGGPLRPPSPSLLTAALRPYQVFGLDLSDGGLQAPQQPLLPRQAPPAQQLLQQPQQLLPAPQLHPPRPAGAGRPNGRTAPTEPAAVQHRPGSSNDGVPVQRAQAPQQQPQPLSSVPPAQKQPALQRPPSSAPPAQKQLTKSRSQTPSDGPTGTAAQQQHRPSEDGGVGRQAASRGGAGQEQQPEGGKPKAKEWVRPGKGYTKRKSVADLIGQIIEIPGPVFGVDVPDMYYRAKVTGNDTDHADAVVVKMLEDKARWYFPAGQVREWVQAAAQRHQDMGDMDVDHTTGQLADTFAAAVLTQMSTGNTTASDQPGRSRTGGDGRAAVGADGVGECTQELGGSKLRARSEGVGA